MKAKKRSGLVEWRVYRKNALNVLLPQLPAHHGSGDVVLVTSEADEAERFREAERYRGHLRRAGAWFHLVSDETEAEWLVERAKYALLAMQQCVEVNSNKRGGVPVLRGTRFTVAQLFAEISEGRSLDDIAEDFELNLAIMKQLMESFAIHLDRPFAT